MVFAVRKGNPKNIKTWDDLIKPGVEVITPNPFTSGGAQWNIMAAYGAQIEQGKTEAQALDYLKQLFENVAVQDKSAREALQTFIAGKGDVLIAYENEAITAQQKGEDVDYVIPDETILIENPIAVTTEDAEPRRPAAFVDYLRSARGAEDLRREGLPLGRSTTWSTPSTYPDPPGLFTIDEFGGWRRSATSSSTRRSRSWPRSSRSLGCQHRASEALRPRAVRAAAPGALAGPAVGGRARDALYLSLVVLIPLAAVVAESTTAAAAASGTR